MKIYLGELNLEVIEMLIAAKQEWLMGAGHVFTVEGIEFGAIPVPDDNVVILIHHTSGVHLTTIPFSEDVQTFDDMMEFIQKEVMVPTCAQFEERGVAVIEAEFIQYEKDAVDRIGPKPDVKLNVVLPYEPPENLN